MTHQGARVVITGPGRAGTTLLVQVLTKLGLDTGMDRLEYFEHAAAGYEADPLAPDAPHVVKNPEFTFALPGLLESGEVSPDSIECLVVPLRELSEAAASRLAVTAGSGQATTEGGLTGTKRPGRQRTVLAEGVYALLHAAAAHDIPVILIEYPRFARDAEYAHRRLAPILGGAMVADVAAALGEAVDTRRVRSVPISTPRLLGPRIAARRVVRKVRALATG